MSTHEILIVPVVLEPHPNADTLSLVRVGGWTVVVRTSDWIGESKGIYVPPDYVVPNNSDPKWAFLGPELKHRRIKVKKLRGIYSEGLLVKADPGMEVGQNVIEQLSI